MLTQRVLSPHRVLPLILTIPLLLLLAIDARRVHGPVTPYHPVVPNQLERHDLPAGWGDDVIQDALPAPPADDDETRRKPCTARVILNCDSSTAPPFRRPGRNPVSFSALDALKESLLSGRPPPPSPAHT